MAVTSLPRASAAREAGNVISFDAATARRTKSIQDLRAAAVLRECAQAHREAAQHGRVTTSRKLGFFLGNGWSAV